jgi:hypothetical protein
MISRENLRNRLCKFVSVRVYSWLVPMENVIVDLKNALRERLAIVHDKESRRNETMHLVRLQNVSEKIEKLEAALPRPIDPQLAHYLQRKSYDKALDFLENG